MWFVEHIDHLAVLQAMVLSASDISPLTSAHHFTQPLGRDQRLGTLLQVYAFIEINLNPWQAQ